MNIRNQLAGTEEEIPEKRMVAQIYISLPSEYDSLIKVIKYGPREQQTLDNVINTLMEEENSKNNKLVANNAGSSLTSGSGLIAYSRKNSRGRGGSRGRRRGRGGNRGTDYTRGSSHSYGRGGIQKADNRNCWHCGISGHKMSERRKLQYEQRKHKHRQGEDQVNNNLPDTRTQGGMSAIVRATMASRHRPIKSINGNSEWIVDSGATHHLCRERRDFQTLYSLPKQIEVIIGNGSPILASAKGTIKLNLPSGRILTIKALLVPKLHTSLLSVNELEATGAITFFGGHCFLAEQPIAIRQDGIYLFKRTVNYQQRALPLPISAYASTSTSIYTSLSAIHGLAALPPTKMNLELWHQRLGHLSMQSVKAILKMHHQQANMKDMKMSDIDDIQPETDLEPRTEKTQEEEEDQNTELCSICVKTKIRRKIIRKPAERSKQPFELIHSDLCGPITPPSKGGARYFILYIDDFSRTCNVYFLRTKTAEEVVSIFQQFTKYIATQFPEYPIRRFRCDNGKGEYDNQLFRGILSSSGISFEPSPPYTQHKNGVSERMIATITTKARAMMIDSCLDDSLWSEAVNTAVYLHALCPSRALEGKTPHEV
jgi:hypothetical protein